MTPERPETIVGRMRAIADWLDDAQTLMLRVDWNQILDAEQAQKLREHMAGTEMQDDLRIDADSIEMLATLSLKLVDQVDPPSSP